METNQPFPARPRVALVGGGAGGIGAACAAALLASGHRVVLAGRTHVTLTETASTLGGAVDHVLCDLADPAAAADAVTTLCERHGSLDVVVANAGGPAPGRVLDVPAEQWHDDLDLLVLGPLALMRAALPAMAGRGFGRIVVITSTAVRQPQAGLAASTVLRSATTPPPSWPRSNTPTGVSPSTASPPARHSPRGASKSSAAERTRPVSTPRPQSPKTSPPFPPGGPPSPAKSRPRWRSSLPPKRRTSTELC